jgi:hypothetical protein
MKAVPRRSKRAAGDDAETTPNGTLNSAPEASEHVENGALAVPEAAAPVSVPAAEPRARQPSEPGLYGVLGLDQSASDIQIQTTYRRQAARLLENGATNTRAMRELNSAYEVLGNPFRRAEYDRLRSTQSLSVGGQVPVRPGLKMAAPATRRRRPRHAVQPRYAGLPDVVAVLMVVGLAVVAGFLIIPRLSINLSALNVLQNVVPLTGSSRRVIDTAATPATVATPSAPTPTPRPGVVERFASSTVTVANPNPAPNSMQTVVIRLRRDNQPAANYDVWATVQYRTTQERWPATGSVRTDPSGTANITFNIGAATPNFAVQVRVFTQVDDQQLSWSTSFTPR